MAQTGFMITLAMVFGSSSVGFRSFLMVIRSGIVFVFWHR
jgi:hypothetical protein